MDWPVTFMFWGNATVAKVDNALSSRLPIWGIDEYMLPARCAEALSVGRRTRA